MKAAAQSPRRPPAGARPEIEPGLLLLNKEAGLTSFQSLAPVKRALGSGRVGHAGTLDKFAEGLLLVLCGSYTRLTPLVTACDKEYRARIRFGIETSTLDPEGGETARALAPCLAALESVLPCFRGDIEQRPPAYSAVHIQGKRAYERARSGEEPEMPRRKIHIYELCLESYDGLDAIIFVRCSSGTYIRSLARDMALAAGSRAHLLCLRRLRIGPFDLDRAVGPGEADLGNHVRALDPLEASALGFQPCALDENFLAAFRNGNQLSPEVLRPLDQGSGLADRMAVYARGRLVGLVRIADGRLRYDAVLGGLA